jgi:putative DNA primase/helicase
MSNNTTLTIAVGLSAKSKVWKNKKYTWDAFVKRLSEHQTTNETAKEFHSSTRDEKLKIKDVGGYVGGYLIQGKRSPKNVGFRQIITLDIDFANKDFWDDFTLQFDNAAVLHSTHAHKPESPRLRLIMPINREVTPDEYVAISRQVAGVIGIELFDNTTFETNRLMFWPSTPKDVPYYFKEQKGKWLDADAILSSYPDWKDSSLWPTAEAHNREVRQGAAKQEDPTEKKGIVGAFCRTYNIHEAIEKFLPHAYTPTDLEDRYTYINGSAAAGLIIYEDTWAYSHHGTDPCSGKLCNAFDLVRIHLYGDMDADGEASSPGKAKSFIAMDEFARKDESVKLTIAKETLEGAKYDFGGAASEYDADDTEDDKAEAESEPVNVEWAKDLEVDGKGKYLSTAHNINTILRFDPKLRNRFKYNMFDSMQYVTGPLPWREFKGTQRVKGVDFAGLRNYLEVVYGIKAATVIDDAVALEFERQAFHPIRDYLTSLKWDGRERLDTLAIDFLGADDNIYHREVMRKALVGAVARVMRPGCKFEMVVTFIGVEGAGKSTLIKTLGGPWFSDSFHTLEGNKAFEQLRGSWLIEMAELAGLKKTEVESVKHFISKQEDIYRPAFGKVIETYPRQCVFFGTTNEPEFLKGSTGNRRFLPIDCKPSLRNKNVWDDLTQDYVDQVWAEAYQRYIAGETLYLSDKTAALAKSVQQLHTMYDERLGMVEEYVDMLLPEKWSEMEPYDRRAYYLEPIREKGVQQREFISVAEIWCECLGRAREEMDRYKTREINDIMKALPGWKHTNKTMHLRYYGKQKVYERKID